MPPKKKGGKKGKKRSGKKSGKPPPNTIAQPLTELGKEFFLIQIRDLEQRLARYQKRCDELEILNNEFDQKFEKLETDKREIIAFWKRQVEQKSDEIGDMNDRLLGITQSKDFEKQQYDSQLQQLRSEFLETKDQLTSENMVLSGKLAALEEFRVQKEDLMAKCRLMDEELNQKNESHKETIYALNKKQVIDKDRLKKEMVQRVNQVAAEFRKVSNKQMAETTKRTIGENVSITSQMVKLSDKTLQLIQECDDLRQKEKKNKQLVDLLEHNEKELVKKNCSNQKIIQKLTDKCRTQENLLMELAEQENEFEEKTEENVKLKKQLADYMNQTRSLNEQLSETTHNLNREMSQMESTLHYCRKLEKVLANASEALKKALQNEQLVNEEDEDLVIRIANRDNMLKHLLYLLNSAATIGVGPFTRDLGKKQPVISKEILLFKKKRELPPISDPLSVVDDVSHYQLGDLGLIPRPTMQIWTNLEKMRYLSPTTRLGMLSNIGRIGTRTIGVQTVSTPKAFFFADRLMAEASASTREAVLQVVSRSESEQKSSSEMLLKTCKKPSLENGLN